MDLSTLATVFTAVAAGLISYLLQKPYVSVVKMFKASNTSLCRFLGNVGQGAISPDNNVVHNPHSAMSTFINRYLL